MFADVLPKLRVPFADWSWPHHPVRQARLRIRETVCALHGHDLMLHVEPGRRIRLRCVNCGYQTPGWSVK